MLRLLFKTPLIPVVLLVFSIAMPATSATVEDAERQSMSLPGMGPNGRLECDDLLYQSRSQTFRAVGSVVFRSDDYNIDADEILFDEVNSSLHATGDRVQLEVGTLTAIATALDYNPSTGGMTLNRRTEDDPQPCVLEEKPDSIFTAYADSINIENDENGDPVIHLEGHVRTFTTPKEDAEEGAMTESGPDVFGTDATIHCAKLDYNVVQGTMNALGHVVLNMRDIEIASDAMDYSEASDRLTATGESVDITRADVEAVCTRFTYQLSSGRMILERDHTWDDQPEVWQIQNDDIFHARADQIFMNELESGGTAVDWNHNTLIELYPVATEVSAPATPEARPSVRIDNFEQIPNLLIDPFA